MKQVIIAIVAIAAIIGGAVLLGKNKDTASGTPSNNVFGNEQASVTLVEYGDFECPACGAFFSIVKQIKEEYKDQIRFEFRNFPLVQIHPNTQAAHRAAQAAANQGKFWEMHDLLYERQASWRSNGTGRTSNIASVFEGYAEELSLDMDKFRTDVASSDTLATINADIDKGKADGATGTPTMIINGKKIDDLTTIDTIDKFRTKIDEALGVDKNDKNTTDGIDTTTETVPAPTENADGTTQEQTQTTTE